MLRLGRLNNAEVGGKVGKEQYLTMLRLGGRGKVGKEQYLAMLRLGSRGKVVEEQYLTMLHYHHQNELCMKMASNESHVNIPIIMREAESTESILNCNF